MKKIYKRLLILIILFMPITVFASNGSSDSIMSALFVEVFMTLFVSLMALKPLVKVINSKDQKKLFWQLFATRLIIVLFLILFTSVDVMILDFLFIFLSVVVIIPIFLAKEGMKLSNDIKNGISNVVNTNTITQDNQVEKELKCSKCNALLKPTDKFCNKCGTAVPTNNTVAETVKTPTKVVVGPNNFDKMYSMSEDEMIEEFLDREFKKAGIDKASKLIPSDALKKKKFLSIIFSVLVFVFVSLIFFHFPIYTYVIGIILLVIFYKFTMDYNIVKYLKKQLQSRPDEKISNIVMNVKNSFTTDNSIIVSVVGSLIALILPLIVFSSPRIIYEKTDGGYAVRYYIFGVSNYKTATIPAKYKGEKVVTLRGNTFSNMPYLETVKLPDTVVEIRGQAFKNCKRLKNINMPKRLEYLGGGAFYHARSLKKIELPDTLTRLGGESFYGASSLEKVKLSNNLTEIRGDTFEYCTSLKSISIPDKVTRIGGHAFYGDTNLEEVKFSEMSDLEEIGSSAFRQCNNLYRIVLPYGVDINERAFKESPTDVHYFGEIETHYIYRAYKYLTEIGYKYEINSYNSIATTQNAYIMLKDVKEVDESPEYLIEYSDPNGVVEFILNKKNRSYTVNDNVAVEVDSYDFNYYKTNIDLKIYYN